MDYGGGEFITTGGDDSGTGPGPGPTGGCSGKSDWDKDGICDPGFDCIDAPFAGHYRPLCDQKTVTVTAVDDGVPEGAHTSTITHTASSSDDDYDGISIDDVTANIREYAGHWKLDEGGCNVTITAAPSRTAIVIWPDGVAENWGSAAGAFFKSITRE